MASPSATPTRFIGLDLHKHYLIALDVNPAGEPVGGPWRVTLEHLDEWAHRQLTRLDAVAVEITTNTYTVYDVLRPLVHSVTVVHPPHLALITRVPVKTDQRAAPARPSSTYTPAVAPSQLGVRLCQEITCAF